LPKLWPTIPGHMLLVRCAANGKLASPFADHPSTFSWRGNVIATLHSSLAFPSKNQHVGGNYNASEKTTPL